MTEKINMPTTPPVENPEVMPRDIPHVTGLPEIAWPEMPLEPEQSKSPELQAPLETITIREFIGATAGYLILKANVAYKGTKKEFLDYATRFHFWKNTNSTVDTPQIETETPGQSRISNIEARKSIRLKALSRPEQPTSHEVDKPNLYHGVAAVEEWEDMLSPAERLAKTHHDRAKKIAIERSQLHREGESTKQMRIKERQAWLDPRNVLDLRNAIDEEIAKKLADQKLLGEHIRVGDKEHLQRQEIIGKLLEEYFHASTKTLEEGKQVPMWLQEKVADMLDLPKHQLKEMAKVRADKASAVASSKQATQSKDSPKKPSQARTLKLVKLSSPPQYRGKPLREMRGFQWPPQHIQEKASDKKAA